MHVHVSTRLDSGQRMLHSRLMRWIAAFATVAALALAPTAASASTELASWTEQAKRWVREYECDTLFWPDGSWAEECVTIRYCKVARRRGAERRGEFVRCVKVAPWQRGTRTYQSTEPPKSTR